VRAWFSIAGSIRGVAVRIGTFTHAASTRLGIVSGDSIIDLAAAAPELPRDMIAFLTAGTPAMERARQVASGAKCIPLAEVKLEAPISRPPEFLAIGLNYADHIAETKTKPPDFPVFFNKQSTCVTGPYDPIHLPRISILMDYEGELGFVIGRRCRHVPRARAHEVIAGFLIVNDVSVRDWQMKAPTHTLGKSFDTHGPIGPWLVTPDEAGDPHSLELRTFVNGELRQHSNTRHLVFNCYVQIETLSTVFTLLPGTVISTGTPPGVGAAMNPPRFLKAGDVVRVEIERIGHIENRVIDEPENTSVI
jgi:2-keto-4-pentenoate hydratase/2-oxohepta-3-ene-1,7-dioic acid hydratase in catechol pathway